MNEFVWLARARTGLHDVQDRITATLAEIDADATDEENVSDDLEWCLARLLALM